VFPRVGRCPLRRSRRGVPRVGSALSDDDDEEEEKMMMMMMKMRGKQC